MAERKRSKDGIKETEKVPGVDADISQGGRAGGEPNRQVASADELKQATKDPAGRTRVTDSLKKDDEDQEDE
ncbi:hypothetical protein SAMN04490244_101388 [Tranquillimonas rosea]|uniref:Uncharacterized protein n=1 Tax=Tranquillimonas rosea TaxID=641238 RepID=A0A1H9PXT9_9RHOB|nr:hypothetical protein [Tranquillimonas rosea]SER53051.1 hypothetical protein SAMN04490244_101388 [Tranquillimonas rosea]